MFIHQLLNHRFGRPPKAHAWTDAVLIVSVVMACALQVGTQASADQGQADSQTIPPARSHYMGRRIAQTMHWMGAEWLIRETRENEENPRLVMKHLGLEQGMTVADVGCGNGFYTLRFAKAVGQTGKVYAVEIQPEYFPLLEERAAAQGVKNIVPTLGTLIDPRLPDASCDVIFLADVYHEFSHPQHMLVAMRKALKPEGRLVLLEFRGEDPSVPIKALHKMTKAQVNKELTANGFQLAEEFDGLPWQHMMHFVRSLNDDDESAPETETSGDAAASKPAAQHSQSPDP